MKIAVLADFPKHRIEGYPQTGAPKGHHATWLPQTAESFAEIPGLEAHWIVMSAEVEQPLRLESFGQEFHVLPTSSRGRASSLYRGDRRRINETLRRIQPDLVHGWGSEDVYGWAAVRSGLPHLVSMQGILTHYITRNRMGGRDYLCAGIEWSMLRGATDVSCESRWAVDLLGRRRLRARLHQVEYGVDPRFYSVDWRPDPNRKAVVFVGTVTPRKGVEDLVRAFAQREMRETELWICGGASGPYADRLRGLATPNVKWLGYLGREETAERMARAWCLALPTRCDTSPNVVKEARVIGLPVVSTPCGGQSDYIEEGRNGFMVEPGEAEALREALTRVTKDLGTCLAMGRWLHAEHRDYFRPGRTGRAFADVYESLLSQQPLAN